MMPCLAPIDEIAVYYKDSLSNMGKCHDQGRKSSTRTMGTDRKKEQHDTLGMIIHEG